MNRIACLLPILLVACANTDGTYTSALTGLPCTPDATTFGPIASHAHPDPADNDPPQVCTAGQPDPRACDPADTKKTTVCHIPPGNPSNEHTICVGNASVPAHLAHGDLLGSCCDQGDGGDGSGSGSDTGSGSGQVGEPTQPTQCDLNACCTGSQPVLL
jgi:hypothetical protein